MVDITGQVQMGSAETHQEEITEAPVQAADESITEAPNPFDDTERIIPVDDTEPIEDNSFEEPEQFESPIEESTDGFDPIQSDFDDVMDSEIDESFEEPVENNFEEPVAEFDSPAEDFQEEENSFEESEEDPIEEPVEESQPEAHFEPADEVPQDFSMATEPDTEPVDITEFANSEVSSLEDGEFLYNLSISRLDSKDLKEALKYVLLDDKLKINHHEYMKKIKDGKVVIPNLNPIKAKRIVEQLQYYDVDIKWIQKRVVMETIEPEEIEDDESMEAGEDANI